MANLHTHSAASPPPRPNDAAPRRSSSGLQALVDVNADSLASRALPFAPVVELGLDFGITDEDVFEAIPAHAIAILASFELIEPPTLNRCPST